MGNICKNLFTINLIVQLFIPVLSVSAQDSLLLTDNKENFNASKCDYLIHVAENALNEAPEQSIFYAEKAFQMALRLDYEKGLANSYLVKGRANEYLNRYDEAFDNYLSSLVLQKHLNSDDEIAYINYRLGRICKTIGNYAQALEYCLNALRIWESQEKYLRVSDVYNTMGSIYKYLGDYEKSLDYYLKSMEIQKIHRKGGISANIYNNIGIVYNILSDKDKALRYYFMSLEMRRKEKDSVSMATSYNNIGVVFLGLGQLDSAIYYLNKSLLIKEKADDREGLIFVYNSIAEYYYKSGDYKKAKEFLNKSLSTAHQFGISQQLIVGYKLMKDIYLAQKNFEKALEFQIKHNQLKDSVLNVEKSMRIAQLEVLYESELKQVEHDLNDKIKTYINIAIYSALFFLLVILFFIYKSLKAKFNQNKLKRANLEMEKEKLEYELDTKNKELSRNIIHLTEKNELLCDLKNTLEKLKSKMKSENKPLVQSVINEMNASHNNKIWEEFEIRFNDVHENFYDNLCNEHPDLTQNEKRLASFLRLNMSSKEISMITRQSVHSIGVARTRLRKKLGLANTDINLATYFSKF